MDADEQTQILRDIADNLSLWKKAGPKGPEHSEYVRKAAIKSKQLLWENVNLLHYCRETYKCKYRQSTLSLDKLNWEVDGGNLTLERFAKKTGEYAYQDYAHDDFINECLQWANKIEKGTDKKWSQFKKLKIWSDIFGFSESTMRRRFKEQGIPNEKMGRLWRVEVNQLPQDIVEKIIAVQRKKELNEI